MQLSYMPLYELTHDDLTKLPGTTLHDQLFREREDLQRLLKSRIAVIGEDLLVLDEEFSQWEDSRRRVDLLALDSRGSLVVIELKRSEDGGHMELQALRYAAMISTLKFHQAVDAHARFLNVERTDAERTILEFLDATEPPEDFGKTVRIILVSPGFSPELTTAVLWLNSRGLEIKCVRIRPYKLEQRTLLEIDQIIPLPEAQDYTVRIKEKQEEARQVAESTVDFTKYNLTVNSQTYKNLSKRNLVWRVVESAAKAGLTLEQLKSIIPSRKIVIVDGHPRGEDFLAAAQKAKLASGYVFRPKRLFIDDEYLIDIEDKTVAISNQWGLPSLPRIDEIIKTVPSTKISYERSNDSD